MAEDIEQFDKHIGWLNKLAPYKLKYRCSDDCQMAGCPSHIAEFEICHATDLYRIDFGDGTEIYLDGVKMAMIKEFMDRFEVI